MVKPIVLSAVCGVVSLLSFVAQRPAPARDVRVERPGTGSLAGVVTDTGQAARPLRNARVTLNSDAFIGPRFVATDDDGKFEFGGLPAGQYTLAATKAAYLTVAYGASRPRRLGTSVSLTDGQRVANLRMAIPRGAVITGRVRNAAGEPVSQVLVTAQHWRFYHGERTLVNFAAPPAMTDSLGEYRLYGLEAGDYVVAVEPSSSARGIEDVEQLADTDVDRALAEARQPIAQTLVGSAAVPARRVGLASIFHPGTANGALAAKVTVSAGEERAGIDIRIELVPMAKIDGTVTSPDRRDLSGAQVILTSLGPPSPSRAFGGSRGALSPRTPDRNGRFSFTAVPPGEYRVMATTQPRTLAGGGRGASAATDRSSEPAPENDPLVAFAMLSVNGDDQSVALTLQPAMTMSGRVVFAGNAPPSPAGTRVVLEDRHLDQSGLLIRSLGDAAADGRFNVNHLWPGRFVVSVTPPASLSTSGWALKSILFNGRDLLDTPFELQPYESRSDVVVTFSDRTTELTGTLQAPTGVASSDYFIVVFSTNQAFWFPNSRRTTATRPNANGAYLVRNLPPGEYLISAVTDVEDGEWFDPEFLNVLRASNPLKLTIGDGETKQQNLQIRR